MKWFKRRKPTPEPMPTFTDLGGVPMSGRVFIEASGSGVRSEFPIVDGRIVFDVETVVDP